MTAVPRSGPQRKADVLAKLGAPVADAWVATAGPAGPCLIPLTLAWHDDRIVLATAAASVTARNLAGRADARIALGGTRDVVLIDAVLEDTLAVTAAETIGAAYAAQNDWDPRTAGDSYVFLTLRPERIRAWREENELAGRTVMRDGAWLY